MLKKKFFAKALAFALVMGTVSVYGSGIAAPISIVQAATDPVKATITVDYENYTATIKTTNSTDTYVFLEVLKDQNGTKVASTYCCAVGTVDGGKGAVIDLSFLKATKEQYVRAYGNTLDSKGAYVYSDITKIAAQPAKLSIKYDPLNGLVDGKTKEKLDITNVKYEFKSLYGSKWADLTDTSLKGMEIAGNTIVIRKKADNATEGKKVPASAEVKVKITAIPKAPKVKIDYVKGTINFGKGTEYIKSAAITDSTVWVKNADSKALPIADILTKLSVSDAKAADTAIIVHTAKTDKKAASALSFVTIPKQTEIQNADGADNTPGTSVKNGGTVTIKNDTTSGISMKWENTTKGISLKAEKAPFQYYDEAKKDWKTIAEGKTVEVKMKDASKLKVRVSGKKETKDEKGAFASSEVELTCSLLPATITVNAPKTEFTAANEETTCTIEIKDGNGETLTGRTGVKWTSSNPSVASVDASTGKVTAVANGTTTITAKLGDAEGKIEIKVEIPAAS